MKKSAMLAISAACLCLLIGRAARAEDDGDEKTEKHEMAQGSKVNGETLEGVKVSLQAGLAAAEKKGKPLSAKFEMDDGKLQLSVYAGKGGKFSEIIVDHKTGKVSKTEELTGGEDVKAAQGQRQAMSKAKIGLRAAIGKALLANKGFQAISVVAAMKDGRPVAQISLGREDEVKMVSEQLD